MRIIPILAVLLLGCCEEIVIMEECAATGYETQPRKFEEGDVVEMFDCGHGYQGWRVIRGRARSD